MALRRGWWIVVGSTLIVIAAAMAVESVRPIEYRSTVVLAVPPSLGRPDNGDVDVASSLTRSLRQIIPRNADVQRLLARRLDLSPRMVSRRIRVSQPGDSTVLRLTYRDRTARSALVGAEQFARAVSAVSRSAGERAGQPADIPPDSIRILEVPHTARLTAIATVLPYSATASIAVRDPASITVDADGARRLATTYASLITEDDRIVRSVREAVTRRGASADDLEVTATSDVDTSVVEVTVAGSDRVGVFRGGRAVARAVSGRDPVSENIVPFSLNVVSTPDGPPARQGASREVTLIAAAVVGVLLGLIALVGWERRQRRVARGRDVTRLLEVPASVVSVRDGDVGRQLLDQWRAAGRTPPAVVLLPADARARRRAETLADALNGGSLSTSVLTSSTNGGPVSPDALTVLVARDGTPSDHLVDAFDDAVAQGRRPGWAVLAH